jgi:hypothetical protein
MTQLVHLRAVWTEVTNSYSELESRDLHPQNTSRRVWDNLEAIAGVPHRVTADKQADAAVRPATRGAWTHTMPYIIARKQVLYLGNSVLSKHGLNKPIEITPRSLRYGIRYPTGCLAPNILH